MLLGYNTNGFTSHALDDALRVIAGLGYRSVAITIDHAALNPFSRGAPLELARVRALLEELDLVPVIETGARFLLDPWRKHRPTLVEDAPEERARRMQFLERAIDIAASLAAPCVSLWSGARPEGSAAGADEIDERLVDGLGALARRAAGSGVALAFEPEPGMHVASMTDFDRIVAAVGHPALRLTLDVGHAHLTEDSAAETVRRYAPRLANVHLEGMRRPVHDHLAPWEGDLDLGAVVAALREVGYAGPATFELSRHSHAAVDTARRAIEFIRAL